MNEEVLFYCLVINAVHQIGFGEASATKDKVIEDAAEEAAQAEGLSEGTNTMSFFFTIG